MKSSKSVDPPHQDLISQDLESLVDQALRSIAQPPAVDLKARVLAALDRPGEQRVARPAWPAAWGRAAALAGAFVVVLVVLFVWQRADRQPNPARQEATGIAASTSTTKTAPPAFASVLSPAGVAKAAPPSPGRTRSVAAQTARVTQRSAERPFEWQIAPIDTTLLNEPYLPGAPAGDLGDPLAPLPTPPSIAFSPIVPAPPISDIARPVTDFPADDQPPDGPARLAGQSGGTPR